MLALKYKPVYEVSVSEEILGYVENLTEFQELIENEILNTDQTNVVDISFIDEPTYEMKLISRTQTLYEENIIEELKSDTVTTYRYYEVALNNEIQAYVDTLEEAEQLVNTIKEEYDEDGLNLDLQINVDYTQDLNLITTDSLEVATASVELATEALVEDLVEEVEEIEAIAVVNDVNFLTLPVIGTITSRYGESSSLRKSTHTGLDIAASSGTSIKAVSNGTIIFAEYNGSYGNLVKIDHGNGVETWYGHCSKIYVSVGDVVEAEDIIAAVGSTGNSTGPHLHFEIRINGSPVNPQKYIY